MHRSTPMAAMIRRTQAQALRARGLTPQRLEKLRADLAYHQRRFIAYQDRARATKDTYDQAHYGEQAEYHRQRVLRCERLLGPYAEPARA